MDTEQTRQEAIGPYADLAQRIGTALDGEVTYGKPGWMVNEAAGAILAAVIEWHEAQASGLVEQVAQLQAQLDQALTLAEKHASHVGYYKDQSQTDLDELVGEVAELQARSDRNRGQWEELEREYPKLRRIVEGLAAWDYDEHKEWMALTKLVDQAREWKAAQQPAEG